MYCLIPVISNLRLGKVTVADDRRLGVFAAADELASTRHARCYRATGRSRGSTAAALYGASSGGRIDDTVAGGGGAADRASSASTR